MESQVKKKLRRLIYRSFDMDQSKTWQSHAVGRDGSKLQRAESSTLPFLSSGSFSSSTSFSDMGPGMRPSDSFKTGMQAIVTGHLNSMLVFHLRRAGSSLSLVAPTRIAQLFSTLKLCSIHFLIPKHSSRSIMCQTSITLASCQDIV